MTDVELLPLPRWMETYRIPGDDFHTGPDQYLSDRMQTYARANVAHATAAKDAAIEALRAEVDALTARLGYIYQIADAALAREARNG